MVLDWVARIGVGAVVFIVMMVIFMKNSKGMPIGAAVVSELFFVGLGDAYLIITRDFPVLKTIGVSVIVFILGIFLIAPIASIEEKAFNLKNNPDEEGSTPIDYASITLMLINCIACSVLVVLFLVYYGKL